MNLQDYFFLFFDEDGAAGAGSASVADDPPGPTTVPGSSGAALPALPKSKPDPLSNAGSGLADDLLKKTDDKKEDTPGADDKKEGEEGDKPDDDKKEGEEGKPEGEEGEEDKKEDEEEVPELTDEEREEIAAKEVELEEAEKALKLNDLWSSSITPETAAWIEDRRKQRMEERAAADAAKKIAEGKGLTEDEKKELAELTQNIQPLEFNSKDNWRSLKNVEETERFQPEYLTAEKIKKEFGIDPERVPAKFAPMINALIARHNRLAANSSYIFKEAKSAYKDRDGAKDQLLTNEFKAAVTAAGFDYDDSVAMLKNEAKSLLHVNGHRVPWQKVIGKLAEKHKKVFSTKTPVAGAATGGTDDPGAAAAAGTPTQTPAAPAVPKIGSRKTDPKAPVTKPPAAKTLREASEGFAGDLAKILEKGRG